MASDSDLVRLRKAANWVRTRSSTAPMVRACWRCAMPKSARRHTAEELAQEALLRGLRLRWARWKIRPSSARGCAASRRAHVSTG